MVLGESYLLLSEIDGFNKLLTISYVTNNNII